MMKASEALNSTEISERDASQVNRMTTINIAMVRESDCGTR